MFLYKIHKLILAKLAAGENMDQILDAHPRLTREAIQAALVAQLTPLPATSLDRDADLSGARTCLATIAEVDPIPGRRDDV